MKLTAVTMRRSTTALFLALLLAVPLPAAGCARRVAGTALAEPPPHVFPDVSGFTAIDPERFYVPLRGGPTYQFTTPGKLRCEINARGPWCSGRFSSDPFGSGEIVCAIAGRPNVGPASFDRSYAITRSESECRLASGNQGDNVLAAEQKTTIDWAQSGKYVCAVGPSTRVACKDETYGHGFVIEPTGAWTF